MRFDKPLSRVRFNLGLDREPVIAPLFTTVP